MVGGGWAVARVVAGRRPSTDTSRRSASFVVSVMHIIHPYR